MKKIFLLLSLAFIVSGKISMAALDPLPDGDFKRMYADAEIFFTNENYTAALPLYLKLDSIKGNANLKFKIGFCYLNAATYKTKSIPYFEEAMKDIAKKYQEGEINEKQAPLSTSYYLAKAYHLHYDFDKAIEMYERYKTELGTDPKFAKDIAEIDHDVETCRYGKELIKDPKKVVVTNLGEGVNTPFPDYSPVVSLDEQTLVFTSRRTGGYSDAKELNGMYFEDIFTSDLVNEKWSKAKTIGSNINTAGHEATVNLSADGLKLLIYRDNNGNGNLFLSEYKNKAWTIPEYVGAPINTSSWESHACFSADNRILYFVSDRSGGLGGRDIYKCLRLPNGDWGPAQNLGSTINTPYDEDGVFIHPDGKQIFFSSKGHKSMGGFDIFSSLINDENGNWAEPINIGYPVNTPDDDVFYITTADGRRAFFSSDKEGGFGEKDIYMISFPEYEPRNITILVGRIINNTTEDISNNTISIVDTKTNDTLQVLNANGTTGKFGTNLPVGTSYKAVYVINGKEIFSEILEVPTGKGYQVIKREIPYGGNAVVLDSARIRDSLASLAICDPKTSSFELYFGYNKKSIDTDAKKYTDFIAALTSCLAKNPSFEIEIESSASKVPTTTYGSNENLTKLRAKEAKDKVIASLVKNGADKSKIRFTEAATLVQGPEYNNDFIQNRTTYEQYQYIRIRVKRK
jgi:Tol biopolymer transport system component